MTPTTHPELFSEDNSATYSPEDNKLRLYVGRVPRPEYEALRAQGWTSTPKQTCDFVAHWTPERRDTALAYAGLIGDEDISPEDRAADRAERFGGYLDKRIDEATGHADRYDAGPSAHGYQSEKRAERAAARHDRIADRAGDAWSKAEYWQRRTAGVIAHALYSSRPDVRMGRIKTLEAEQRKHAATLAGWCKTYRSWQKLAAMTDPDEQTKLVRHFTGSQSSGDYGFKHPRPETVINAHIAEKGSCLWTLMGMIEREYGTDDISGAEACAMWLAKYDEPQPEDDWSFHYSMRLAYENQMLEAQGGRAASVEMIAGGFLGSRQIQKVNKSTVTGRVVSVAVWGTTTGFTRESGYKISETRPCLVNIETERLAADAYRPPTAEELAAFETAKKEAKKAAPKKAPCPLVNPTDEDAERLQSVINERAKEDYDKGNRWSAEFKPGAVIRITQAQYSANSKGSYARAETRGVSRNMEVADRRSNMYSRHEEERRKLIGPAVCEVRFAGFSPVSVIVLTDKPQKPLPAAVWALPQPVEAVTA